jgi:hypothetical protein
VAVRGRATASGGSTRQGRLAGGGKKRIRRKEMNGRKENREYG